ncbi:DNA ligase, variant 2 [Balamuthia mandrillaris]
MKESVLGKLYVQILGISPESEDARRLIEWRKPSASGAASNSSKQLADGGDFGTAVQLSLSKRCPEKGSLSIADVNSCLDELNAATDRDAKVKVLKQILRSTTAVEQKWLVRIILKELKMGLSEKLILNYFHPDAVELFNVTSSLRKVCAELKDPTFRLSSKNASLFQPVKPMLASRRSPELVTKFMGGKPFSIETKFDGERVQLHKDGKNIKLYSRNSNDVTAIYGPTLIPHLLASVLVTRCIIDGELLVWDSLTGRFEDFGKLKSLAQYEREKASGSLSLQQDVDIGTHYGKRFCYMAFDLLYVNDKSVLELTLSQRMTLLKRCIKSQEKVVEVVQQTEAHSTEDVVNALDAAIMNREEGIMVKDMSSTYVPNERKDKWIKIKPEYIEGLGDDLDLIILGGYYGTGLGRRGGSISHFLLGVVAERDSAGRPSLFYSLAKVGSGYTDNELQVLQTTLQKYWKPYSQQSPPSCFLLQDGKERPDVWVEPKHSRILQVKAAQLVVTEKYKAGYTLRFPRVVMIRSDKSWLDCMDLSGIITLAKEFEGRYAKRRFAGKLQQEEEGDGVVKKRSRGAARKVHTVGKQFQDTDVSHVAVKQLLFRSKEFCVMSGDHDLSKQQLETLIHEYGGTKVQHPTASTFCVIAARETLKVKNLIQRGVCDVVHYKWLLDCVHANKEVPLEPKYMLFTTKETKSKFLLEIDRFGDSYTKDATEATLQEAFRQFDKELEERKKEWASLEEEQQQREEEKRKQKRKRAPRKKAGGEEEKAAPDEGHESEEPSSKGRKRRRTNGKGNGEEKETVQEGVKEDPFSKEAEQEEELTVEDAEFAARIAKMEEEKREEKLLTEFGRAETISFEEKYFVEERPWWALFRNFVVYLDCYRVIGDESSVIEDNGLVVVAHLIRFYGGRLSTVLDHSVTHVVFDPFDLSRLPLLRKRLKELLHEQPKRAKHLVDKRWVEESVLAHDDLDEREYLPPSNPAASAS